MEPSEKGWIDQYLRFIGQQADKPDYRSYLESAILKNEPDRSLYKMLQPSGLMYGHPVRPVSIPVPGMEYWDEKERMKVILLDSFLHSSILMKYDEIRTASDLTDLLFYTTDELNQYYRKLYPEIDTRYRSFMGKKKTGHELTEEILTERLSIRRSLSGAFWSSFFQNSLLFLDVFYFGEWMRNVGDNEQTGVIPESQESMRLTILEVIAAAAQANEQIETEEKLLFEFFLHSAHLSGENEKLARTFLGKKMDIREISLPPAGSWVLRKYLLELAILTIWSDKLVEASEKDFITKLGRRLDFTENEIEESMLAIESFVVTNWEHVHYLQKKHNIHLIRKRFSHRIGRVLKKNKNALAQEIRESHELITLLRKSASRALDEQERLIVRQQLIDILKTLPTFVVIALPGTFITLPLLLKLLPRSAFPSAFNEENILLK